MLFEDKRRYVEMMSVGHAYCVCLIRQSSAIVDKYCVQCTPNLVTLSLVKTCNLVAILKKALFQFTYYVLKTRLGN